MVCTLLILPACLPLDLGILAPFLRQAVGQGPDARRRVRPTQTDSLDRGCSFLRVGLRVGTAWSGPLANPTDEFGHSRVRVALHPCAPT